MGGTVGSGYRSVNKRLYIWINERWSKGPIVLREFWKGIQMERRLICCGFFDSRSLFFWCLPYFLLCAIQLIMIKHKSIVNNNINIIWYNQEVVWWNPKCPQQMLFSTYYTITFFVFRCYLGLLFWIDL